jgi:hypothetical protein
MSHRLTLSVYLQEWDGTNLSIRVLIAPRGSPLEPLGPGEPAFVDWEPHLEVRQVQGLDVVPMLASPASSQTVVLPLASRARSICLALEKELPIDGAAAPIDPRVAGVRFMKYAPKAYRQATGYGGSGNPYVVTDDRYRCAIQRSVPSGTSIKVEEEKLPWGKVLGLALRQPLLAEAVGIVRTLSIQPLWGQFDTGGWVYVTLSAGTPGASLLATLGTVKFYAARVPILSAPRRLFTAVLFPVSASVPPVSYDEVFREAVNYDDGFAKAVYVAQQEQLDPFSEEDDGTRPARDLGIQIGWDDEQVATWLNRQVQPAAATQDAPMGVLGYRIDAREVGQTDWSSLVLGRTKLVIDGIDLGAYEGEFRVEVAPNKLMGDTSGDYWCPTYFADWNGPSLAGPDTLGLRLQEIDPSGPIQGIDPEVKLRYGSRYDFRVRLVDHTGGGPGEDDLPSNPSPQPIGSLLFKRYVRPGAVMLSNRPGPIPDPDNAPDSLAFRRPRLGYPAYVFAGGNATNLLADLAQAKLDQRAVGLADPDVDSVEVRVLVERPDADEGWIQLYTARRRFPSVATDELVLDLEWLDVADATTLTAPAVGSLPLPTSRNVRLEIIPLAVDRSDYYAASDVRYGELTRVDLRRHADDETSLLLPQAPSDAVQAYFLQPDLAIDAAVQMTQKSAGQALAAPGDALGRLAAALDLVRFDYGLRGLPRQRLVLGCSSHIRHVLGPDGASIRFASDGDITRQWIIALRATLNRDWSWDGLQYLSVERDGGEVGRIEMRRSIGDEMHGADEGKTDLLFLDAIDPRPAPGAFPKELELSYRLVPIYRAAPAQSDPIDSREIRCPITTPPEQVPRLMSAGFAMSPYRRDEKYTQTEPRDQVLWFEFDAPPQNSADRYFVRFLAYSPDPVLARTAEVLEDLPEPPLPIDPEPILKIVPGQSDDRRGLSAMDGVLLPTESDRHFIVPLPKWLTRSSPELFGFFTYEVRVGHLEGWCSAQGRYYRPLRVTGVQHPAPTLECGIVRSPKGLEISANFAQPIQNGRAIPVFPPATEIWILLYCQVSQADGSAYRNVLLSHKQGKWNYRKWDRKSRQPSVPDASATWSAMEIENLVNVLGLGKAAPLSCIAVETLPAEQPIADPLGAGLGYERFLRTSPLTRIPGVC